MGQFDSSTEAALARLKSEGSSKSQVDGTVDKVANLGGYILEAIGFSGVSGGIAFLSGLKKLAVGKDEGNLIYFGDALLDDIRRLYRLHEELKFKFDERIKSDDFNAVVANATLHITRTNVEIRLKRLAHIITNSVKEDDLEPERLDDMLRAAVELTGWDVTVLGKFCESQKSIVLARNWSAGWSEQVGHVWSNWNRIFGLGEDDHLKLRSALSRLQSLGMIADAQTNFVKDGSLARQAFGLLPEGKYFYERLREIGDVEIRKSN
jgi:hypothetical protein